MAEIPIARLSRFALRVRAPLSVLAASASLLVLSSCGNDGSSGDPSRSATGESLSIGDRPTSRVTLCRALLEVNDARNLSSVLGEAITERSPAARRRLMSIADGLRNINDGLVRSEANVAAEALDAYAARPDDPKTLSNLAVALERLGTRVEELC
jgi:hypothetical protein